jgi:hypothetical protein
MSLCDQCESCRWWRVMRGECSQRTPAISWGECGRTCEGYQRAVGEDWHAMLYGNSDTRRMHQ